MGLEPSGIAVVAETTGGSAETVIARTMVRTGGRLPALGMVRMAQGFQHRKRGI